ncbi:MAG: HpcH/HpaI aldolase/citrate lyase family protein [Thalassobaculaceae bacterium]|jgi:citrate lyase subunit beta/citryl-CoA lyase|tara:strand:- start:1254 stop:2153 length:900 start_codon:yes stop_codon:yes gene_type:complete
MKIEKAAPPVWRSMLYVPATSEKFIEKAHERGADAIKIDLEDAVALAEKPRARTLVRSAAKTVARGGADVLVRINRPLRMAVDDLEASVWPEVHGLVLPKVESADHIGFLAEIITELEDERDMQRGHIKLMALIETPRGYSNVRDIANSSERLSAIALGQEDFSAEMGMVEPEGMSLLSYYQTVQVAAREAGILPIGYPGSIAEFTDLELFKSNALIARKLGFDGGACIHPKQVPILNEAFTPTDDEIDRSERMVAAYDAAMAAGDGAVAFEGKMIDVPVVARAERILSIRDRIKAKET